MAYPRDYLFAGPSFRDVLEHLASKMCEEIDGYDTNRLLNTSGDELSAYFAERFKVDVPSILEEAITADGDEVDVDVSRDFDRAIIDRSRPVHVKGYEIKYHVPYEGDGNVFGFRPSSFSMSPPQAVVSKGYLEIAFRGARLDPARVRADFQRALGEIRSSLDTLRNDGSAFNAALQQKARARIEERRQKALNDRGILGALGVPLRKREDAPQTYAAPSVRRRVEPKPPPASSQAFVPEPVLPDRDYEAILEIISSMVHVIERSPKAFAHMGEEDLRQHFLVQLNGQYHGAATGETFNYEGKTDILIREGDRNIFVAECKFWKGPKALLATLDQILAYLTWRDTKTAIILFNRKQQFSTVLARIPEVVKEHAQYRRTLARKSGTDFQYVFAQKDDPGRELLLTILAFDVPGPE